MRLTASFRVIKGGTDFAIRQLKKYTNYGSSKAVFQVTRLVR